MCVCKHFVQTICMFHGMELFFGPFVGVSPLISDELSNAPLLIRSKLWWVCAFAENTVAMRANTRMTDEFIVKTIKFDEFNCTHISTLRWHTDLMVRSFSKSLSSHRILWLCSEIPTIRRIDRVACFFLLWTLYHHHDLSRSNKKVSFTITKGKKTHRTWAFPWMWRVNEWKKNCIEIKRPSFDSFELSMEMKCHIFPCFHHSWDDSMVGICCQSRTKTKQIHNKSGNRSAHTENQLTYFVLEHLLWNETSNYVIKNAIDSRHKKIKLKMSAFFFQLLLLLFLKTGFARNDYLQTNDILFRERKNKSFWVVKYSELKDEKLKSMLRKQSYFHESWLSLSN